MTCSWQKLWKISGCKAKSDIILYAIILFSAANFNNKMITNLSLPPAVIIYKYVIILYINLKNNLRIVLVKILPNYFICDILMWIMKRSV